MTMEKNRQIVQKRVDAWIKEGEADKRNGYAYAVGYLESTITSILSRLEDEEPDLYQYVINLHFPEKENNDW